MESKVRTRVTISLFDDMGGWVDYEMWPEQTTLVFDNQTYETTTPDHEWKQYRPGPSHCLFAAHGDATRVQRRSGVANAPTPVAD